MVKVCLDPDGSEAAGSSNPRHFRQDVQHEQTRVAQRSATWQPASIRFTVRRDSEADLAHTKLSAKPRRPANRAAVASKMVPDSTTLHTSSLSSSSRSWVLQRDIAGPERAVRAA
eukprot:2609230-Amphidinium_carterae.1